MNHEALMDRELLIGCNAEFKPGDRFMAYLIATIASEKFKCGVTFTLGRLREGLRDNADNPNFKGVIIFDTDLDYFVRTVVEDLPNYIDRSLPIGVITTTDEEFPPSLSDKVRLLRLRWENPNVPIERFIFTLIHEGTESA